MSFICAHNQHFSQFHDVGNWLNAAALKSKCFYCNSVLSCVPTNWIFVSNSAICAIKGNNLWQYGKNIALQKVDNFLILLLLYFNTVLVRQLGNINIFLLLWAQFFYGTLGIIYFWNFGHSPISEKVRGNTGS